MVGQEVWVDGTKKGRIAYIGTVHFAKGEMAGGANNALFPQKMTYK